MFCSLSRRLRSRAPLGTSVEDKNKKKHYTMLHYPVRLNGPRNETRCERCYLRVRKIKEKKNTSVVTFCVRPVCRYEGSGIGSFRSTSSPRREQHFLYSVRLNVGRISKSEKTLTKTRVHATTTCLPPLRRRCTFGKHFFFF